MFEMKRIVHTISSIIHFCLNNSVTEHPRKRIIELYYWTEIWKQRTHASTRQHTHNPPTITTM